MKRFEVPTEVWTGAYGFRDCDALGWIWARTADDFEKLIREVFADESERYASEDETPDDIIDQLWYVGPFLTETTELLSDLEDSSRTEEMREDLQTSRSGYVY